MTLLKTLLFTVLVPGSVTALMPFLILTAQAHWLGKPLGIAFSPAWFVIAVGVLIYGSCAWGFSVQGRGTPAPIDPPKHLVVHGLYRYSRNAMYIGALTVLAGEAILFASILLAGYAVLVLLAFQLFIVTYEEPTLRRLFGSEYDAYCATVPRWIPRLRE